MITRDELRTVAFKAIQDGKKAEVAKIINETGQSKNITRMKPEYFQSVLDALKKL